MIDATSPELNHNSPAIPLELGGRRFPQVWDSVEGHSQGPAYRLNESPDTAQLPQRIESTLWKRLAWNSLPAEQVDVLTLIKAYNNSLNQLNDFRDDIQKLVRAACLANIEFRLESGSTHEKLRETAIETKLDEMLKEAACDWRPFQNLVSGRFASQSAELIKPQLHDSLQHSVHQLVSASSSY